LHKIKYISKREKTQMAFENWHDYGIGIKVSDIKEENLEGLEALLERAPAYRKKLLGTLKKDGITEPTWEDYLNATFACDCELADIMANVISEAEGIDLCACSDQDAKSYLMYKAKYPWDLTEADKGLTRKSLEEVFRKYTEILTKTTIEVGEQSCYNLS